MGMGDEFVTKDSLVDWASCMLAPRVNAATCRPAQWGLMPPRRVVVTLTAGTPPVVAADSNRTEAARPDELSRLADPRRAWHAVQSWLATNVGGRGGRGSLAERDSMMADRRGRD